MLLGASLFIELQYFEDKQQAGIGSFLPN